MIIVAFSKPPRKLLAMMWAPFFGFVVGTYLNGLVFPMDAEVDQSPENMLSGFLLWAVMNIGMVLIFAACYRCSPDPQEDSAIASHAKPTVGPHEDTPSKYAS